jgi:hypothetical protein
VQRLGKTLQLYDKQLKAIRQEIKSTVDADAVLQNKISKITTLKGVGLLTAAIIIAKTNGFALFTNQKQLLILIYTLWNKEEAWQENKYLGPQPRPKEAILSLEVGASLSGVCAADQNKVAPTSRATQDEHPTPIGQGLSFR